MPTLCFAADGQMSRISEEECKHKMQKKKNFPKKNSHHS